jgi:hypothetical protein
VMQGYIGLVVSEVGPERKAPGEVDKARRAPISGQSISLPSHPLSLQSTHNQFFKPRSFSIACKMKVTLSLITLALGLCAMASPVPVAEAEADIGAPTSTKFL